MDRKAYALRKINTLITQIEYIRDNKLDEEIALSFFNLSCLLDNWLVHTIYMGKVIESDEKKAMRREKERKLGISVDDEEDYQGHNK